jgi:hypothetical protein
MSNPEIKEMLWKVVLAYERKSRHVERLATNLKRLWWDEGLRADVFRLKLPANDDSLKKSRLRFPAGWKRPFDEAFHTLMSHGCDGLILGTLLGMWKRTPDEPPARPTSLRALAAKYRTLVQKTRPLVKAVRAYSVTQLSNWDDLEEELLEFAGSLDVTAGKMDARLVSRRGRVQNAILHNVRGATGRPHYEELATLFSAIGRKGISANDLRMWRRRHRMPPARIELGLAIVKHLVGLHRGTVSVTNRRDGGAVFTVTLSQEQDLSVGATGPRHAHVKTSHDT